MNISNRAKELFVEALTIDSDTRAEFVVAACGADDELLDEVNSLLDASEQSEAYFDQLAGNVGLPALAENEDTLPTNKLVGQWRLLELIGRGGMGSVYLAERADEQFEKRAALKILPFGIDGKEARSRFLLERQILARLVHDNIARLLDGGVTAEGTPYFVMDYVDGEPLDIYCDKHELGIDERLALFCRVGEAVQYAHRNLVVHRDLKPSNVLVGKTGDVKLLDFGIAKTLYPDDDGPQLTRTGISPMTSLYASPEMLKREPVTTQSDVYALGVLLYELLAGSHPYGLRPGASGPEIWQHVCDVDPIPPSKAVLDDGTSKIDAGSTANTNERAERRGTSLRRLQQRLRGDLDTIVAKAMQKDPEKRYESVEQFLADIRRHQSGMPVLAQPPNIYYRVRKFIVRRKGLVAAGLASLIFVFTVAYQSNQTAREADRANREADVAQQVSEFLISIFEVSNPQEARGNTITARELLDRGAEEISKGEIDDPEVRARLMSTVAFVYQQLALYAEAENLFDNAIELQRQTLGESHQETLLTIMRIGMLYLSQGRFEEAEDALSKSLAGQRHSLGKEHEETLESLHNLAIAHAQQGDFATAAKLGEELVPARQRALGAEHASALKSKSNLAIFYKMQGHYDRAEPLYLEVLEVQKRVLDEDHPDVISVRQNLADLYGDQSRYTEAVSIYEETLQTAHRIYGAEHPQTTRATVNLANTFQAMGEFDKAEELYVNVVAVQRATLGDEHPETLNGIAKLGELYTRQERYEPAKTLLDEALASYRKALGDGHTKTLDTLTKLLNVHYALGDKEMVRELQTERVEQRRKLAEREGASAQDKITFAWILVTAEPEDLREPTTALRFAIDANEETNHSDPRFMQALAFAYDQTGDRTRAVQTQQQAIELLPAEAVSARERFASVLRGFEGS